MELSLNLPGPDRVTDVLVLGENSMDLVLTVDAYPSPDTKEELRGFDELPGGEAATAAVGLARLGWRVKYIGRFGDDRWGARGRHSLSVEGVDISDAPTVPGETSRIAVILVDRGAGRRTVLWRRGPRLALQPDDASGAALAGTRVLLVGSDDVEAMTDAARRARTLGVRTVGDIERRHPGTSALLRELDIIVMAESFPKAFTGETEMADALRSVAESSGAALTCVTLGARGCMAFVEGQILQVPAIEVDVVDTTGAGDLFRAGLIARWLMGPAPVAVEDLLRYATVTAGLNCRGVGARGAAPTAAEVAARLR